MAQKIISIDGRQVAFKATAATPRVYRQETGRDLIKDMQMLIDQVNAAVEAAEDDAEGIDLDLSPEMLTVFEDASYIMAKQANPEDTPATADKWLDTFEMFSIWQVLPEILDLWKLNNASLSESKKK